MTQKNVYNWIELSQPAHFSSTQPNPLYCNSPMDNEEFIVFTPTAEFDQRYCLYKYDILQNKYIKFASFEIYIKLSSHHFNPKTNEIYVFGGNEYSIFGVFNLNNNEWTWNKHIKYDKYSYSISCWINNEIHLYRRGIHAKYDPQSKDIFCLNDEHSFLYTTAKTFTIPWSAMICIEGKTLLLLPGDQEIRDIYRTYFCVIDSDKSNEKGYEWKLSALKLPEKMLFSSGSQCVVALGFILIVFVYHSDVIWFCDLKGLGDDDNDKEYEWIKTEWESKLPADDTDKYNYRIALQVVLTKYHFVHFIKQYRSYKCDPYHILMSIFQLFPQKLIDKYINPMIYGYLRQSTNGYDLLQTVSTDIYRLIYSFAL
eukprot:530529_1